MGLFSRQSKGNSYKVMHWAGNNRVAKKYNKMYNEKVSSKLQERKARKADTKAYKQYMNREKKIGPSTGHSSKYYKQKAKGRMAGKRRSFFLKSGYRKNLSRGNWVRRKK